MKWLIWSYEHGKWWKDHKHGYTDDIMEAGRYSAAVAQDIVINPIGIEEVAVPENIALERGNPSYHPYDG